MSERAGVPEQQSEDLSQEIVRKFDTFRRFVVVCGECQSEMSADWQFCTDCGARLSTECPSCGQPLPPMGVRFCPHCGLAIPVIAGKQSERQ